MVILAGLLSAECARPKSERAHERDRPPAGAHRRGFHRPVLHVAVIGPAGHGKSAMISRLLAETGCRTRTMMPGPTPCARRSRDVLLIDDPESELLRDSLADVTQADAAVLVVDSTERKRDQGLVLRPSPQAPRHPSGRGRYRQARRHRLRRQPLPRDRNRDHP